MIATFAIIAVIAAGVLVLSSLNWTTGHLSPLAIAILNVRITDGVVPILSYTLAVAAVLFLLARRARRGWIIAAAIGAGAGAGVAVIVLLVTAAASTFGVQLSQVTAIWGIAVFSAVGLAVSGFFSRGWMRKTGTAASIVILIFAGIIGINGDFGLNNTAGEFVGVSTERTVTMPVTTPKPTATPTTAPLVAGGALWANWRPPAGMPAAGTTEQVIIPNTISGFKARPAGLYLPPAALVANPPALPLVIMMMGQPGNPDPSFTVPVLDRFAARHNGLAPIVLVADQIGNPAIDPLCLDTKMFGNSQTYLAKDVVGWARTHLHVLQDAAHWTIAGYSNGGECALQLGVTYPQIWGNVLDISGEMYPGADKPAHTLATAFGGNVAAYQATWPLGILANGTYPDTVAIFTVGSNDGKYRKEAIAVNAAATAAKWKTTYFEVLNGGHVRVALDGGLQEGYAVLYPRLGLSDPATAP